MQHVTVSSDFKSFIYLHLLQHKQTRIYEMNQNKFYSKLCTYDFQLFYFIAVMVV